MTSYRNLPMPKLSLYQLTLNLKGVKWHAYSMGTSVDHAYARLLERSARRFESSPGLELVSGELADPNIHLLQ